MGVTIFFRNKNIFRKTILNSYVYLCSENKNANCTNKGEDVSKESLQWRISWEQEKTSWYSKLKVFGSDSNNIDILRFLQSPIDFRLSTIRKWWKRKQEEAEIATQQHLPERNRLLGDDLAAAHFIVFRGGSVKFYGEDKWIKQNEKLQYDLPNIYIPSKIVEAIDCSNMQLHFEGLENLRGLSKIKWFSINNCEYMDDWCLDRIIGMFKDSLEYLDLRNCKKISYQSIGALYKIKKLQTLYVDGTEFSKSMELTCLMLQELLPSLKIKICKS